MGKSLKLDSLCHLHPGTCNCPSYLNRKTVVWVFNSFETTSFPRLYPVWYHRTPVNSWTERRSLCRRPDSHYSILYLSTSSLKIFIRGTRCFLIVRIMTHGIDYWHLFPGLFTGTPVYFHGRVLRPPTTGSLSKKVWFRVSHGGNIPSVLLPTRQCSFPVPVPRGKGKVCSTYHRWPLHNELPKQPSRTSLLTSNSPSKSGIWPSRSRGPPGLTPVVLEVLRTSPGLHSPTPVSLPVPFPFPRTMKLLDRLQVQNIDVSQWAPPSTLEGQK